MVARRSIGDSLEPSSSSPSLSPAFREALPTLYEYLFHEVFDDGTPRVTSSLSIFTEAGALKLALNDREQDLVAFLTIEDVQSGLETLESRLCADSLDWRPSRGGRAKKKGGRR